MNRNIINIISSYLTPHTGTFETSEELAKGIIRIIENCGYDILENDLISVEIRKEIERRIIEQHNIKDDDILKWIGEELNNFEKKKERKKSNIKKYNNKYQCSVCAEEIKKEFKFCPMCGLQIIPFS